MQWHDDPKQVGADRVVDAAAAQKLYGGPACIVDFGTATTFDAISAEGDYLGGAIAPGIGSPSIFARSSVVRVKLPPADEPKMPMLVGLFIFRSSR